MVLHGPEIIDSGCALKLIRYIQRRGRVTAVLGGTMGRVALMDAGLKDTVQISPRRRPSQSIQDLEGVSYTHLRAHETPEQLVCRPLLEKKNTTEIL